MSLIHILAGLLFFNGLISIWYGLRKQSKKEKLQGKNQIDTFGKGGRIHLVYLGIVFVIMSFVLLLIK